MKSNEVSLVNIVYQYGSGGQFLSYLISINSISCMDKTKLRPAVTTKDTRYNINWRNNTFMRKTAKHYLFNHVRTSFLNITADEMAIAIFLPVARFKKGNPY